MPTQIIPCENVIDCPGADSPFANTSSEIEDIYLFVAIDFQKPRMPLGGNWGEFGEAATGTSPNAPGGTGSQAEAGFNAQNTAGGNAWNPPPAFDSDISPDPADDTTEPPTPQEPRDPRRRSFWPWPTRRPRAGIPPSPEPIRPVHPPSSMPTPPIADTPPVTPKVAYYFNDEQTCTATCAIGTTFSVTVAAGAFKSGRSKAIANQLAYSQACKAAQQFIACIGPIDPVACADTFYSDDIEIIRKGVPIAPSTLTVNPDDLPPGITISGNHLEGNPTTPGTYPFDVNATILLPPFTVTIHDILTIRVMEITTSSPLPQGAVIEPYSETLAAAGTSGAVSWQIDSGALPPGLTLEEDTGIISGTPTTAGTYNFTVSIQDQAT